MRRNLNSSLLIATCYRCERAFAADDLRRCPSCGGGAIVKAAGTEGGAGAESVAAASALPAPRAGDAFSPRRHCEGVFLPGVHAKAARRLVEEGRGGPIASNPRPRGGTSVYGVRRKRREGAWAVGILPVAAVLASFAVFLQGVH